MVDISDAPETIHPGVTITPTDVAKRQSAAWRGIAADVVQLTRQEHFEYGYCAPRHLLIAAERGERREGETFIEGLPRSTRHDFNHKLTFVPAGREFHGWQEPRALGAVDLSLHRPQRSLCWIPSSASTRSSSSRICSSTMRASGTPRPS